MRFRRMTTPEIEGWYTHELCTTFAAEECKPLADIRDLIRAGRYEPWGLFEEGSLVGYAMLWTAPKIPLVLIDYFGVTASRRSAGLGVEMLSRLKARGRPIVLEAELPIDGGSEAENALRERRIAFYARCGFSPVYRMATCGLAFQALLYDPVGLSMERVMRWHRALYGAGRNDVQVPLPAGCTPSKPYWMEP